MKKKAVKPFQGKWEVLRLATSKPELILRGIDGVTDVWYEKGDIFVKIKGKKLFLTTELKFKLQRVENKPSVIFIMSGGEGTLVLTITIKKDRISCEASWNGSSSVMKGNLGNITEEVLDKVLKIAEMIKHVIESSLQLKNGKVKIEELSVKEIPTVVLYAYLLCSSMSCEIKLEGALDELLIIIKEGIVESVEYSSSSTTFTTRLGKNVLELTPTDFEGTDIAGMYTLEITPL